MAQPNMDAEPVTRMPRAGTKIIVMENLWIGSQKVRMGAVGTLQADGWIYFERRHVGGLHIYQQPRFNAEFVLSYCSHVIQEI